MSIIGIDSGTSFVKLIDVDEQGKILHKLMLGKKAIKESLKIFINKENIDKNNISRIILTGVGEEEILNDIDKIPVTKIDEFRAIGKGGLYISNKKEALVVSIGTGTAFVNAKENEFTHLGGTGVGGGTLINLCKKLGNINSVNEINNRILNGNLENVDLTVGDITTKEIEALPKDTTSANFGKLNDNATSNDIIRGIANMVFEAIGVMAVFAAQSTNNKNIIVIGNVATMPYINKVLKRVENLHKGKGIKFIISEQAEYATVIGAVKLASNN